MSPTLYFFSRGARLRIERSTSADGGTVFLQPCGELDMLTTPTMSVALQAALEPGRRVVLDLGRVTFLGTHGIRVLLDAWRSAQADGGELFITGAGHRTVAGPLALTGIDKILPLVETPPAAEPRSTDP